eukprot:1793581-Prymnesium_polylepis.1
MPAQPSARSVRNPLQNVHLLVGDTVGGSPTPHKRHGVVWQESHVVAVLVGIDPMQQHDTEQERFRIVFKSFARCDRHRMVDGM